MKKVQLIILYLTVVLTTTAQTIGEAFYVYRNDGQFNAFFRDEVDSILYSHYDADSLFYEEIVTQLVYTVDSVYRIPLAAIDSVGFVQPETKYKEDAVPLIGNLFDYIISSDSLSLTFALSTPSSLLPNIGDKLVATDLSDKLPIGFTGTVRQVEQTDNGYVVSCDSLALEEVVEQFYGVVEIVGQQSDGNVQHYLRRRGNSEQTHPFRLVIPPINQYIDLSPIVKPKGVYDIDGKAVGNIAINPVISGKITRIIDNRLNISHYNIHAVTDVTTVTTVELAGEAINSDNPLNLSSPKTNFCIEGTKIGPYGIPIYYAFGPKFDISGEIALGTTVYADFTHTEDINYYSLTAAIGVVAPVLYPLANQFNTVQGATKMTHFDIDWAYIAGRISARVAVCGRLGIGIAGKGHNLGWVGGEAQTGFKVDAELGFDFEALSNAEKGTGFYDGVKDNAKVVAQPYWGLEGKMSVLDDRYSFTFVGSDDYSFWGKKWKWDLLPKFSDTKATIISSSSAEVSANITNDCILPISVGFSLFDENGNRVGEPQWNDQKFRTRESFTLPYQTTFSDLTINKEYKAYPTLRLFGFNVLASPSVTLVDQDAEAYCVLNDSTLTFYYDGNMNNREGKTYNLSYYNNYNSGNQSPGWKNEMSNISKVVFNSSFAEARPKYTSHWFSYEYNNNAHPLSEIVGLEYLNTSDVEDMRCMFFGCSSLKKIDVSKFDTNKVMNMSKMFYGCNLVDVIDVSHFDTKNVSDMSEMFAYCKKLTNLDVSHFDTHKVTKMQCMFDGCENLINLDVSGFSTENVTDMCYMFSDCGSLVSLDVAKFNTSKVTNMGMMFMGCSSLNSINISNFNTANVTDIQMMFADCSSLTSIDVRNFDTSNVTDMSFMFFECNSLTELDLSSFNTEKVKSMRCMIPASVKTLNISNFTICESPLYNANGNSNNSVLEYIDLSRGKIVGKAANSLFEGFVNLKEILLDNIDTSKSTEMRFMFSNCTSLTNLNLSSFDTSNVTDMMYMFWGCSSLTNLDLSSFNTEKAHLSTMFAGCTSLKTLNLKNFTFGNSSPGFSGCPSLESINLSNGKAIGVGAANLFVNAQNLKNVDLSQFDTSEATNFQSMFSGCSLLTNIDLTNFDTSNVTNMSAMFSGCSLLTNLDLSNFDTSNVTNMSAMFSGCSSLSHLDLSSFNTTRVSNMMRMFRGCSSLINLNLDSFSTSEETNMYHMFNDCSSIVSLKLNNVYVHSDKSMFEGCFALSDIDMQNCIFINSSSLFTECSSLSNINLRNGKAIGSVSVWFRGLSHLNNIDFTNFDTSDVTNFSGMFRGCSSIKTLDLSSFNYGNDKSTGGMFYDCSSLKTIYAGNWNCYQNYEMFVGCNNLVGGQGTKIGSNFYGYDNNGNPLYYNCSTNGSAAHIDGGKDWPGLFTAK